MTDLLSGGSALASMAIGLFFLRFWRDTHDRLFIAFAAAFALFAGNRVVIALSERDSEDLLIVYSFRAAAFVVLIVAIVDRNRR